MSKKLKFLVILLAFSTASVYAQDVQQDSLSTKKKLKNLTENFDVSGCLAFGSNYVELLGIKNSNNVGLYTEFAAFHKTGIGLAYYAYDDFSKEEYGRMRFVDLAYANQWKFFSLYAAFEYVWYDNFHDGQCIALYAIGDFNVKTWKFTVMPMFMYYPFFTENQYEVILSGKVTKTFLNDLDLYAAIWYDNLYEHYIYGGIGLQIRLPKGFYLSGNLLYKDRKFQPMANFGWRF